MSKRITVRRIGDIMHIEAPGCIVNITVGLHDREGRDVTAVEITADGDRYSGEPQWWLDGETRYVNHRVIQVDRPKPDRELVSGLCAGG
jgi:hypothetical protein